MESPAPAKEWATALRSNQQLLITVSNELFKEFDMNEDGVLDAGELQQVSEHICKKVALPSFSDTVLDRALKLCDRTHTDSLNMQEFKVFVKVVLQIWYERETDGFSIPDEPVRGFEFQSAMTSNLVKQSVKILPSASPLDPKITIEVAMMSGELVHVAGLTMDSSVSHLVTRIEDSFGISSGKGFLLLNASPIPKQQMAGTLSDLGLEEGSELMWIIEQDSEDGS